MAGRPTSADGEAAAYARMCEIFDRACDLQGDARARYLDEQCADDEPLRRQVEDALAEAADDSGFLAESLVSASARAATLPDRIGPYRILGQLGAGGMGEVFLAEEDFPRRQVALKIIRLGALSGSAGERFEREAEMLGRLHHPAIAPVHAAGLLDLPEGRIAYLAMERVDGTSLAALLDGPVPLFTRRPGEGSVTPGTLDEIHRVVRWVEVLASALQAAHDAGVVHRDVKPANIIVTADDEPVLIDFGVALDTSGNWDTLTGTGLGAPGTPAYMSPEQIAGDRDEVDGRSDVWSLAVVLYECLCGQRPFDGGTRADLGRRITGRDPLDPRRTNPAVPRDLAAVVDRALEKDPGRRYASAMAFAEDLRRVRTGEPTTARPISVVGRGLRRVRRHPLTTAVGLLGAAATVMAVFTTSWFKELGQDAAQRAASRDLVALVRVLDSRHRGQAPDPADWERVAALVPAEQRLESLLEAPLTDAEALDAYVAAALSGDRGGELLTTVTLAPRGGTTETRPELVVGLDAAALESAEVRLEGLDGRVALESTTPGRWRPVAPLVVGDVYEWSVTLVDGSRRSARLEIVAESSRDAVLAAPATSDDARLDGLLRVAALLDLGLAGEALELLAAAPLADLAQFVAATERTSTSGPGTVAGADAALARAHTQLRLEALVLLGRGDEARRWLDDRSGAGVGG